jgi:iron(III) transport system permease protein
MLVYLTLPIPIYGTMWIILIAYMTRFLPYGVNLANNAYGQLGNEIEEASYICGATWGRTFTRILVPLISPTLFIGVVYILLRSFRELPSSLLLASYGTEVYSVVAFELWGTGMVGTLCAYGILSISVLMIIILLINKVGARYGMGLSQRK